MHDLNDIHDMLTLRTTLIQLQPVFAELTESVKGLAETVGNCPGMIEAVETSPNILAILARQMRMVEELKNSYADVRRQIMAAYAIEKKEQQNDTNI